MKALSDYSLVRGACYPLNWLDDRSIVERDLGYAKRLGLNSTRIWLVKSDYDRDADAYVEKLKDYVRTADSFGITTMPILWNGNMLDVRILDEENWDSDEQYVRDVVEALKDEKGLIMWDVMNEPTCNDYLGKAAEAERPVRLAKMWRFLHHYCDYVRSIDPRNAITIGHTFIRDVEPTADCVDVISFHDYLETRARIENTYIEAETLSKKLGKPLINSEMGCLGRANPYDMALEACEKHEVGWYLFELIIHGYWGDVHGVVYPDGSVRDPSIVASILGFRRKRDAATSVKPNPNKEGHVERAIETMKEALKQDTTLFMNKRSPTDEILEAAEYCANILESCEMVPMDLPPTARINEWRSQAEEDRNVGEIRAFSYHLVEILKRGAQIL